MPAARPDCGTAPPVPVRRTDPFEHVGAIRDLERPIASRSTSGPWCRPNRAARGSREHLVDDDRREPHRRLVEHQQPGDDIAPAGSRSICARRPKRAGHLILGARARGNSRRPSHLAHDRPLAPPRHPRVGAEHEVVAHRCRANTLRPLQQCDAEAATLCARQADERRAVEHDLAPLAGESDGIARSMVVLPAPFEPITATSSPRRTDSDTPFRRRCCLADLEAPDLEHQAPLCGGAPAGTTACRGARADHRGIVLDLSARLRYLPPKSSTVMSSDTAISMSM